MIKVIGVRFRTAGKIYFFDPADFEIKRGDHVIVETARGIEFGTVVAGVKEVEEDKVVQPLKPVIRIATERDIEQEAANKEREREAFKVCLEKIRKHELDMKLIDAEYTFDNNKVLFYFTADGRIDFRELVKDLAGVFKTRIELRQIGVRDETKIVGGIGICGRPLCCHSYLSDFIPVSIKMAKEQNLSLNPTKISGVCGRLMCCLKNEEETYEELNRRLPGIGDYVTTEDGFKGEVQSVNVLRQLVKVIVEVGDEKEIKEYPVEKLSFKRKGGKREKVELSKEELQELERLEDVELQEGGAKPESNQRQGRKGQEKSNRYRSANSNEAQYDAGVETVDNSRSINEQEDNHQSAGGQNFANNGQRQDGENRNRNDRNRRNNRNRRDNRNRQDGYNQSGQNDDGQEVGKQSGSNQNHNHGANPSAGENGGNYQGGNSHNAGDNGQRQDGENRNRHNRYRRDNKYRNDRRNRQEGQAKSNDSQA